MSKLIQESEIPPTRLELRWRRVERDADGYNAICDYNLILSLGELDIRGKVYDDDGELLRRERSKSLTLGGTRSTARDFVKLEQQWIDTPYRDGAHIRRDSKNLNNLPMFVVADGWAMQIFQVNNG